VTDAVNREPSVALITGARSGIGRALADRYLAKGWSVLGCSRSPSDLQHERYTHFELDVADEAAVRDMVAACQRQHGRLDLVVNNAGIASMNHTLLTPVHSVDEIMATNFRGTFLVSREGAKLMARRRAGRIVNMSSVAAPLQLEGELVYAASKAAIEMLTKILAREVAPLGITCNAVGPPPIDTDLIRGVPDGKIDAIVARLAIKRLGTMDDVANVVDFFASPASSFVTGQIVYLGGP
jgi:3-oxoacyl-[acyl-carrier protein] reductase